ncbi:MAG TPA: glycine cleavage system protein GcvH [Chloroflexota bacterium]
MTTQLPDDLRYTETDEWVRREGDTVVCGITAFAAEQLGDVVYLQLPEPGKEYSQKEPFGEIESVKAVSDLNCPLAGEVSEVNTDLDQNPALVNEDPYGKGWIARIRPVDPSAYDDLLDADAYERSTAERH